MIRLLGVKLTLEVHHTTSPMSYLPRHLVVPLAALAAVLSFAAPTIAGPSPDEIRKKSEEIFSRPEFQSDPDEKAPVKKKASEREGSRDPGYGGGGAGVPGSSGSLITVFAVILLIILVVFIIYQLRSRFVNEDKTRVTVARAQRLWLSETYRTESERLAGLGDYTEAIRYLFLSLVYRFDERGRVSFHKEYTNREYVDLMSERQSVREAMQVIVDILDDNWYGERPSLKEQYEESLAVYQRLAS